MTGRDNVWRLCSLASAANASDHELSAIRELSATESAEAIAASALLMELANRSPYERLLATAETVEAQIGETATSLPGAASRSVRTLVGELRAWRDLRGIDDLDIPANVRRLESAVAPDGHRLRTAGELEELLDVVLSEVETLEAHYLLKRQDDIEAAVELVRGLAAESPTGGAVLVQPKPPTQPDQLSLTMRELPVDEAAAMQEALAAATSLVLEPPIEEVSLDDDGDDEGSRPLGAADLGALLEHVSRATDELRQVWMEAFAATADGQGTSVLQAQWSSLATAIHEGYRAGDRRLEDAGIDPRLAELPPFANEVTGLHVDPDAETKSRQLRMAGLLAFEHLARVIGPLIDEDHEARSPEMFAQARDRAGLVARLSRLSQAAEAPLTGSAVVIPELLPAGLERVRLADTAWTRGDAEAAILHLHIGIRLLIADLADSDPEELPQDLGVRLTRQPALERLGLLMMPLETMVSRTGTGVAPDLGVCVLLVPALLAEASELSSAPPITALKTVLETPNQ